LKAKTKGAKQKGLDSKISIQPVVGQFVLELDLFSAELIEIRMRIAYRF
jgi:hypothetical protein